MTGRVKRIPAYSIFIIFKFDSLKQLDSLLNDPEYQMYQAKLMNVATKKGANCEYFTSTKKSY